MDGTALYAALFANWFLAGIAGGAAAIGTGMAAMPVLILLLCPADIVLVGMLGCLVASLHLAYSYREGFRWGDMKPLCLGCLPGIAAGTFTLKVVSASTLQFILGFVLLSFIVFQMLRRYRLGRLSDSPTVGFLAGVACGFAGAAAAVPGAPLGVYVILRGWDTDRSRGNMSVFFVLINSVTIFAHATTGLYTGHVMAMGLACSIGGLLGQCIGVRIGRGMATSVLHMFILVFICIASCMLFWRAFGL